MDLTNELCNFIHQIGNDHYRDMYIHKCKATHVHNKQSILYGYWTATDMSAVVFVAQELSIIN